MKPKHYMDMLANRIVFMIATNTDDRHYYESEMVLDESTESIIFYPIINDDHKADGYDTTLQECDDIISRPPFLIKEDGLCCAFVYYRMNDGTLNFLGTINGGEQFQPGDGFAVRYIWSWNRKKEKRRLALWIKGLVKHED